MSIAIRCSLPDDGRFVFRDCVFIGKQTLTFRVSDADRKMVFDSCTIINTRSNE